jgi:hypothetical protein
MIIKTQSGESIDTASDLSAEERHILQKLMAWNTMVESVTQFRGIRDKALETGWNNSGPVRESAALSRVIQDMEIRIRQRLRDGIKPGKGKKSDE